MSVSVCAGVGKGTGGAQKGSDSAQKGTDSAEKGSAAPSQLGPTHLEGWPV